MYEKHILAVDWTPRSIYSIASGNWSAGDTALFDMTSLENPTITFSGNHGDICEKNKYTYTPVRADSSQTPPLCEEESGERPIVDLF